MARSWQYALVGLVASVPVYFEVLPGVFSAGVLGLATLLVPYLIARYRLAHRETLRKILLGGSAAIGIFAISTGYVNYLTDEWATPQYLSLLLQGHDWYSVPLSFQYVKMGTLIQTSIWNVYLPLLPLIQVPYVWLDYRWFTLAVWAIMVYAVRKRYYTSMALGGQYPAVMAANGFNDVVPLLFLTLAFVTFTGRRARAAQLLSLGMKQFANAFVFLYHMLRRDWLQAGVTILVSALFILPFLLWDWKSAICTPILDMPPDCTNSQNLTFNSVHSDINFALWPVWIVAVFYPTLLVWAARVNRKLGEALTCQRPS
jgi:hypothetical protein